MQLQLQRKLRPAQLDRASGYYKPVGIVESIYRIAFRSLVVATSTARVLSQVTVFESLFQNNNHLATHHAEAEVKTVAELSPLITQ